MPRTTRRVPGYRERQRLCRGGQIWTSAAEPQVTIARRVAPEFQLFSRCTTNLRNYLLRGVFG